MAAPQRVCGFGTPPLRSPHSPFFFFFDLFAPQQRREKIERRQQEVESELKLWDPHNDPNAQGDAFKTLFVARVNYDTTESKLRREFEVYGPIKRIYMVYNKRSGKPRGYAFIEYEHERDMHSTFVMAFATAGLQLILMLPPPHLSVWLGPLEWVRDPRHTSETPGNGSGTPGNVSGTPSTPHPSRDPRRDRERERERDRRERSRERERRRSRSRERRRRTRSREKDERERKRGGSRDRSKDRERERDRKRRSRSRERKRERERDKKDEGPLEGLEPPEELAGGDGGAAEGMAGDAAEKRDRERERRRGHRERERRREREREREREHKRERERRDERAAGAGGGGGTGGGGGGGGGPEGGDAGPPGDSEMFLSSEGMAATDGYLGAENGYLLEPPME
ncbi:PREDICTED: U1 small nuclear ribonucleoprotein 70 kDa-like [Sturnus vulgaris]|uniref:U1 small nuclear ribonucleoprotein 70 kDa-like n=1 Tax=Sturnus vulgaris TaxID=9172 RepID=UPI00071A2081|nr:PREDICTED: U1 small nuclear ribonucleoprotein 70 kDa-like [Sturnus vulgaris]